MLLDGSVNPGQIGKGQDSFGPVNLQDYLDMRLVLHVHLWGVELGPEDWCVIFKHGSQHPALNRNSLTLKDSPLKYAPDGIDDSMLVGIRPFLEGCQGVGHEADRSIGLQTLDNCKRSTPDRAKK